MNPSKDWKEIVPPDEDARFARFADQIVELQRMNAVNGHAGRALHHKTVSGFEARLEILSDLPEPARHGVFATPKTYDAVVRYSNGASAPGDDAKPDIRGMAVKVLGVEGRKVLGSATTQDFLGILQSVTPFRNADEFVGTIYATRNALLALPRMLWTVGLRTFSILPKLLKAVNVPAPSLANRCYYSALPIQCGPYAARFAFVPMTAPEPDGASTGPDRLTGDFTARLRKGRVEFALELQFFVDETRTPIEDGSVDWPVDIAPYVRVARLTLLQQDAASERGQALAAHIQNLAFDPWHALVEHRPLGGMMRARKVTYFASAKGRAAQAEPAGKLV